MKTKQVFTDEQIKQVLGEQQQQLKDILEITYTTSEQVSAALDLYVEASNDNLRQSQNFGDIEKWAAETGTFLKEKVSEFHDIAQSIIAATKELQK